MTGPRNSIQLLLMKRQVSFATMPRTCPIAIYTNLFAGGAAEINRRRRRRKQSEKTPSPGGGWEVGRTLFRWLHRRPISAVPPGRELISQLA